MKSETNFENITEVLERNARAWPDDVALVEIDTPDDGRHKTWKEAELVESVPDRAFRVEMTWREFDEKANRFANFLLSRGYARGDKIAILLMNGLEWLPIYFGVLKAGCMAVPLNFRYTADEIKYCLGLSDAQALVFGPEFTGRVEQIADRIPLVRTRLYVGGDCPRFAESYEKLARLPSPARGRGGHLLLVGHDRLPEGHRPPAPRAPAQLPRGAEPPRPDEG